MIKFAAMTRTAWSQAQTMAVFTLCAASCMVLPAALAMIGLQAA